MRSDLFGSKIRKKNVICIPLRAFGTLICKIHIQRVVFCFIYSFRKKLKELNLQIFLMFDKNITYLIGFQYLYSKIIETKDIIKENQRIMFRC